MRGAGPGAARGLRRLVGKLSYPHPSGEAAAGVPLPKQGAVHHLLRTVRNVMYLAGVGSGKSWTGAYFIAAAAMLCPGCSSLAVSPTIKMLRSIVVPKLRHLISQASAIAGRPLAVVSVDRGEVRWWNGSVTYLRSADQPQLLEGLEVSNIWFDESEICRHSASIYDYLASRLREQTLLPVRVQRFSAILVTTTPSDRPGGCVQMFRSMVREGNPDYAIVRQSTLENPYLPAGYADRLKALYSEPLYRQRVLAEVLEKSGAIFAPQMRLDPWDPAHPAASGCIVDWTPTRSIPMAVAIDWGYRHPHVLWYQYGRIGGQDDTGVVFRELSRDNVPLHELVSEIRAYHERLGWLPNEFIVDPGGDTSIKGRAALRDAFRCNRGPSSPRLIWPSSDDARNIGLGLEVVRSRLMLANQKRRLLFARSLDLHTDLDRHGGARGLVMCLASGYRWREGPDGDDGQVPEKDGTFDHAIDALRYLLVRLYPQEIERVTRNVHGGWADTLEIGEAA